MKKVLDVNTKKEYAHTMEVDMVRRAETLRSLDELNLTAYTKTYLNKTFSSIEAIIWEGRVDAFEQDLGTQSRDKAPKWKSELISALTDAGFIRPTADFLTTFCVNVLYRAVYKEWKDYICPGIRQLSNELYEEFEGYSNETVEKVKASLQERLSEREYDVLCLRYGLDYAGPKRLRVVGEHFSMAIEQVRRCEARALGKLKYPTPALPAIFEAPNDLEETAEALHTELEEIHKRADDITQELESIRKAPFKFKCNCLKAGASDGTSIDDLGLSYRAYHCLKRAGIRTVADIINKPDKDWIKVRDLGRQALEDVVAKMRAAGYEDFDIVWRRRSV